MRRLVIILLVLIGRDVYSQIDFNYDPSVLSRKTKELVTSCADLTIIEGRVYYTAQSASNFSPPLDSFAQHASLVELQELTRHPNPIIRFYAYQVLLFQKRENSLILDIAKEHLRDTATIITQNGHIRKDIVIGDYIYLTSSYHLSQKEKVILDSLLFWKEGNQISSRNTLLLRKEKNENNYQRLRAILEKENDLGALIPVLSYDYKKDRELISRYALIAPEEVIAAIAASPHASYLDAILAIQSNIDPPLLSGKAWGKLYKASIALDQKAALEVFGNALNLPDEEKVKRHAELIQWNLRDNTSDYLDVVRFNTFPYLNSMGLDYFERIWSYDSLRVYEILAERFSKESHPYWQVELINLMIDKVELLLGEEAISFINQGIAKGYSITYYTLASRAKKYHNAETVKILVKRFNEEEGKSQMDIHYRAKGVINFDEPQVYEQIEPRVFDFLTDQEDVSFAGNTIIELALRINRNRCIETLLTALQDNTRSKVFLKDCLFALLELEDSLINEKVVKIYESNQASYSETRFGQYFNNALKKKGLKK